MLQRCECPVPVSTSLSFSEFAAVVAACPTSNGLAWQAPYKSTAQALAAFSHHLSKKQAASNTQEHTQNCHV
jgi:hypothetical protein